MPKLQDYAQGSQPVNALELMYSLCIDYLNIFIFGYSSGPNFLQDENGLRAWLEKYEHRYCKESFWVQELPRITQGLRMMGIDMLPKEHLPSKLYLENWMMGLCDKADEACSLASQGIAQDPADIPVVYQQIKNAVELSMKGADFQTKSWKLPVNSSITCVSIF